MSENRKPHSILSHIPVIISPFYNPPKAVTLPYDYTIVPQTAPPAVVTSEDVEAWKAEAESIRRTVYGTREMGRKFQAWKEETARKIAPGYLDSSAGILKPTGYHRDVEEESGNLDSRMGKLNIDS